MFVSPSSAYHAHPHPDPSSLISADPTLLHFWHAQQQPPRTINFDESAGNAAQLPAGTVSCQDCGNQAKKDCSHRRCRTCCKSRGLDCSTHVKSTWVSAARRRERHSLSSSGSKKPRLRVDGSQATTTTTNSHTSTSNTPPGSYDTGSSHQDLKESLPGQVKAPAVFKCVRVTAVEDGDDEFAYQAVVKIGGHLFKGFLYDQGAQPPPDSFPNLSDLHLGGGRAAGGRNGDSSSSPIMDPSSGVYGGSGAGFLGGSSYGNTMN